MTTTEDRWQLSALAAVITVTAIVSSLGAPLVPQIAESYDVSVLTAQWTLTATLITGAVATPILGRLGSGRLRRPVILGGLLVVLAGTVLSALPLGFPLLVTGRTLQGVGLALVPLALAVARDAWTGRTLTTRLSLLSVTTVAGAGLGYPITSTVASLAGTSGAFAFGAVLVAATWALAVRFLPGTDAGAPQPVDLVGAALLTAGTICLLLGITEGEHAGWASAGTLTLFAVGAALMATWIGWTLRVERRGGHPLVDLALAARPGVVGPHVVTFALGWACTGCSRWWCWWSRRTGAPATGSGTASPWRA
ncbi:MFS transporter [Nocardioides sambongensis]|uniref:MFS transporter n=1 Tax=Nocardioides sambongensis TaxID=2589074 RepID=UPI0015E85980|nr:MFS transporter [Nocardioides sambongensis]